MANKNGRQSSPYLEVNHDRPEQAADGSYSTMVRVYARGFWEGGQPEVATIGVFCGQTEILPQTPFDLHRGTGQAPLSALVAGNHYYLQISTGGKEIRSMIVVPRSKSPNVLATEQNHEAAEAHKAIAALSAAKLSASVEIGELEKQTRILQLEAAKAAAEKQLRESEVKPEQPDALRVSVTGIDGDYKLHIIVLAKEGKPLVGFKGKVVVDDAVKAFTTKSGGLAVCPVKFEDANCYIEVHAGAQEWSATLVGP